MQIRAPFFFTRADRKLGLDRCALDPRNCIPTLASAVVQRSGMSFHIRGSKAVHFHLCLTALTCVGADASGRCQSPGADLCIGLSCPGAYFAWAASLHSNHGRRQCSLEHPARQSQRLRARGGFAQHQWVLRAPRPRSGACRTHEVRQGRLGAP